MLYCIRTMIKQKRTKKNN